MSGNISETVQDRVVTAD